MRRLPPLVACPLLAAGLWLAVRPSANADRDPPAPALVGDGKTDNTAAIRQFLRKDGTVEFPRGTSRIPEPIVIDLDATGPVTIVAHGNAALLMDGPGPALRFV